MASSMGIKCFTVGLSSSASYPDVVIEVFCFAVFFHFLPKIYSFTHTYGLPSSFSSEIS